MNRHDDETWKRLTAAARGASDPREASAPPGFSTRVAALALTGRHPGVSLLERIGLRALGVAALLAVGSVLYTYQATRSAGASSDEMLLADDVMSLLLDT